MPLHSPHVRAAADDPQAKPGMSNDYLAGYSPGNQLERFDIDHSARLIRAGSDIVLQLHYTPNGKTAMADRTKVGLTFWLSEAPAKLFPRTQSPPPGTGRFHPENPITKRMPS